MSRYSLNLRQKYDRDEPTTGGTIRRTIATAIDEADKYQQADRNERNVMAQAGATPVNVPQPSVMDRVRGIGARINGVLHGTPGDAPVVQAGQPGVMPGATPPFVDRSTGIPDRGAALGISAAQQYMADAPAAQAARNIASSAALPYTPDPAPTATPTNGAATAPVATARGTRPSIADSIQPYVFEGVHGQKYNVDPLYGARVKAAADDYEQNEKIQSLVAAGMSETEARARVLNNVVKYDDTFGQQSRSGTRISNEEWDRRQARAQKDREDLERLKQSGRISGQEYTRRRLELQERTEEDRRARGDVGTELGIAHAIGSTISTDPTVIATETPDQKDARVKAERERRTHINAAVDANTRRKNATATKERAAARAQVLMQQFNNDRTKVAAQMRAEGFQVQ